MLRGAIRGFFRIVFDAIVMPDVKVNKNNITIIINKMDL